MSIPTGLFVLVEEVELDPTAAALKWIKIHGVFNSEIKNEQNRFKFGNWKPVRGWAYFILPDQLPDQKRELALAEWRELATLTGKKKVVAFGSSMTNGFPSTHQLVSPEKANAKPVEYSVDHGMYLISDSSPPAKRLKKFEN